MTWEDKLFHLLKVEKKSFNYDSSIGGLLVEEKNPLSMAESLEKAIAVGNVQQVRDDICKFVAIVQEWKILFRFINTNPTCVDKSRGVNNFKWENGKFQLGYNFAPKGIRGLEKQMLHFSRLIRDAEKRALKHPRFKAC